MYSSVVSVIRKSATPLRSVNVLFLECRSSSSSSEPKDIGVTCKSESLQKKLREKTPIGTTSTHCLMLLCASILIKGTIVKYYTIYVVYWFVTTLNE